MLPFGTDNYSIVNDNSQYNVNQINMPANINKATLLQDINSVSCNNNNFRDDFNSKPYNLIDGQTSPNGLWFNVYAGFGMTGVEHVNTDSSFF